MTTISWLFVYYVACKRQGIYLPIAHDRLWLVFTSCSLMSLRAFCRNGLSCVSSRQPKHTNAKRNTIYYYYCVRYPFKIAIDVCQVRMCTVSKYAMSRLNSAYTIKAYICIIICITLLSLLCCPMLDFISIAEHKSR